MCRGCQRQSQRNVFGNGQSSVALSKSEYSQHQNQQQQSSSQFNKCITSKYSQQSAMQVSEEKIRFNGSYLQPRGRLHLGFLFASPLVLNTSGDKYYYEGIPEIKFKEEFEAIINKMQGTNKEFSFRYLMATFKNFREMLSAGPIGLHFSGHGLQNKISSYPEDIEAYQNWLDQGDMLMIERDNGSSEFLHAKTLRQMITYSMIEKPHFVVVLSCYSYQIASMFKECEVSHVVCSKKNRTVSNEDSLIFSETFYYEIFGNSASVCDAYIRALKRVKDPSCFELLTIAKKSANMACEQCKKNPVRIEIPSGHLKFEGNYPKLYTVPSKIEKFDYRNKEMFQVVALLTNQINYTQAVQIVSMPGLGKSALTQSVANYLGERAVTLYPDGILYLSQNKVQSVLDTLDQLSVMIGQKADMRHPLSRGKTVLENEDQYVTHINFLLSQYKGRILIVLNNVSYLSSAQMRKSFASHFNRILRENQNVQLLFSSGIITKNLINFTLYRLIPLSDAKSFDLFCHLYQSHTANGKGLIKEIQENPEILSDLNKYTQDLIENQEDFRILQKHIFKSKLINQLECKINHEHVEKCIRFNMLNHPLFELLGGHPLAIRLFVSQLSDRKSIKQLFEDHVKELKSKILSEQQFNQELSSGIEFSLEQVHKLSNSLALSIFYLVGMLFDGLTVPEISKMLHVSEKRVKAALEGQLLPYSLLKKSEHVSDSSDGDLQKEPRYTVPNFMITHIENKLSLSSKKILTTIVADYLGQKMKKMVSEMKNEDLIDGKRIANFLEIHERNINICLQFKLPKRKPKCSQQPNAESQLEEEKSQAMIEQKPAQTPSGEVQKQTGGQEDSDDDFESEYDYEDDQCSKNRYQINLGKQSTDLSGTASSIGKKPFIRQYDKMKINQQYTQQKQISEKHADLLAPQQTAMLYNQNSLLSAEYGMNTLKVQDSLQRRESMDKQSSQSKTSSVEDVVIKEKASLAINIMIDLCNRFDQIAATQEEEEKRPFDLQASDINVSGAASQLRISTQEKGNAMSNSNSYVVDNIKVSSASGESQLVQRLQVQELFKYAGDMEDYFLRLLNDNRIDSSDPTQLNNETVDESMRRQYNRQTVIIFKKLKQSKKKTLLEQLAAGITATSQAFLERKLTFMRKAVVAGKSGDWLKEMLEKGKFRAVLDDLLYNYLRLIALSNHTKNSEEGQLMAEEAYERFSQIMMRYESRLKNNFQLEISVLMLKTYLLFRLERNSEAFKQLTEMKQRVAEKRPDFTTHTCGIFSFFQAYILLQEGPRLVQNNGDQIKTLLEETMKSFKIHQDEIGHSFFDQLLKAKLKNNQLESFQWTRASSTSSSNFQYVKVHSSENFEGEKFLNNPFFNMLLTKTEEDFKLVIPQEVLAFEEQCEEMEKSQEQDAEKIEGMTSEGNNLSTNYGDESEVDTPSSQEKEEGAQSALSSHHSRGSSQFKESIAGKAATRKIQPRVTQSQIGSYNSQNLSQNEEDKVDLDNISPKKITLQGGTAEKPPTFQEKRRSENRFLIPFNIRGSSTKNVFKEKQLASLNQSIVLEGTGRAPIVSGIISAPRNTNRPIAIPNTAQKSPSRLLENSNAAGMQYMTTKKEEVYRIRKGQKLNRKNFSSSIDISHFQQQQRQQPVNKINFVEDEDQVLIDNRRRSINEANALKLHTDSWNNELNQRVAMTQQGFSRDRGPAQIANSVKVSPSHSINHPPAAMSFAQMTHYRVLQTQSKEGGLTISHDMSAYFDKRNVHNNSTTNRRASGHINQVSIAAAFGQTQHPQFMELGTVVIHSKIKGSKNNELKLIGSQKVIQPSPKNHTAPKYRHK